MKKRLFAAMLTIVAALPLFLIKTQKDSSTIYKKFLTQTYSKDNIKVIMADLIHDGRDEMIVLESLGTDYFSGMLHIYSISDDGDVIEIYQDDVGEVQMGWRWYYLYKDSREKEYLVQYIPGIYGGSGVFTLDMIQFSPNGSYSRDKIAEVIYDTTYFNEEQQKEMNVKLDSFKEILFQYKNSSEQLIGVGSDMYLLKEEGVYFGGDIHTSIWNFYTTE